MSASPSSRSPSFSSSVIRSVSSVISTVLMPLTTPSMRSLTISRMRSSRPPWYWLSKVRATTAVSPAMTTWASFTSLSRSSSSSMASTARRASAEVVTPSSSGTRPVPGPPVPSGITPADVSGMMPFVASGWADGLSLTAAEGEGDGVGSVPAAQLVSIRPAIAARHAAKRVLFKLIRLLGGIVAHDGRRQSDKVLKNLHRLACFLRNSRYNKLIASVRARESLGAGHESLPGGKPCDAPGRPIRHKGRT